MFKRLFPVLLIAVALLAACVPAEPPPAPTPAPTQAPVQRHRPPRQRRRQRRQRRPPRRPRQPSAPAAQAAASNTTRLRQLDFAPFEKELAGSRPNAPRRSTLSSRVRMSLRFRMPSKRAN